MWHVSCGSLMRHIPHGTSLITMMRQPDHVWCVMIGVYHDDAGCVLRLVQFICVHMRMKFICVASSASSAIHMRCLISNSYALQHAPIRAEGLCLATDGHMIGPIMCACRAPAGRCARASTHTHTHTHKHTHTHTFTHTQHTTHNTNTNDEHE